jgi:hypothetical protein
MSFPRGTELAEALRRVVGGEVRFDSYTRYLFSRDASMYTIEPIGVVFPREAADVAAVVTTAAEFGVPVLPRGGMIGNNSAGSQSVSAVRHDDPPRAHARRRRWPLSRTPPWSRPSWPRTRRVSGRS